MEYDSMTRKIFFKCSHVHLSRNKKPEVGKGGVYLKEPENL